MPHGVTGIRTMRAGEALVFKVSCAPRLEKNETLAGTPTVTSTTTGFTLANKSVNTTELELHFSDSVETVGISKAVLFKATAASTLPQGRYNMTASVNTTGGTVAQTFKFDVPVMVTT